MDRTLYTIGHSNGTCEHFADLLAHHGIDVIADVRSSPYSAYNPQFNREPLQEFLRTRGVEYVFLGDELGARRSEPECYDDSGRVHYDRIAGTPAFSRGIDRLAELAAGHRVALMCAEKDPLTCHRTILICRFVKDVFPDVGHILHDGSLETQVEAESRLLKLARLPERDLFHSREELVEQAYEKQEGRIAFTVEEVDARSS
jgi:uncharacterized protein (DUF488 family)